MSLPVITYEHHIRYHQIMSTILTHKCWREQHSNSPWPCLLLKLTSAEENHIEGPGGVHVVQNEQCHLLGAQQCRPLHGIGHVQQDDDLCCCIGTHFKLGVKGQHARLEKRHAKSSHNDSRPLTKKTLEVCHSVFPPAHPSRTACWQTHHQNIASLSPDRSSQRMFFPRVNFVCWLSFGIHSNPVLPQRQVKDPSHLPKVQAAGYTWTSIHPWPNQVRVGWLCCPGIVWEPIWENEPTCNSSGNTQPPSSQLAEPLWTDSGLKKVELVCTSWSASKIFFLNLGREWIVKTIPLNPCKHGKSYHQHSLTWLSGISGRCFSTHMNSRRIPAWLQPPTHHTIHLMDQPVRVSLQSHTQHEGLSHSTQPPHQTINHNHPQSQVMTPTHDTHSPCQLSTPTYHTHSPDGQACQCHATHM